MLKKIAFSGLGIALLASPLLASADVVSDLQAQIQALMAQIASLQAQVNGSTQSTGPNPETTSQPISDKCVVLRNNLGADDTDEMTGGDVTKLQKFLTNQYANFFDKYVTGYFGPVTEAAVKQWQSEHGLVSKGDANSTGWGYIGPKSRAALAQGCGGGSYLNDSVVTYETSPAQPAQVTTTIPEPRIACPQVMRAACPAGYHYEYGPTTYDGNKCPSQSANCVPDTTTQQIQVVSPNGGEVLRTGSTHAIRWNPEKAPAAQNVKIDLAYTHNDPTYPAGTNFEDTIAYKTPNTGLFQWQIPEKYARGVQTGSFKVKVSSGYNSLDYSDGTFSIFPGSFVTPVLTVSSPGKGETYKPGDTVRLSWAPYRQGQAVGISALSYSDPSFLRLLVQSAYYDGALQSYVWRIPPNFPSGNYYLRVETDNDDSTIAAIGYSGQFTIAAGPTIGGITVTAPNGGEQWELGVTNTVTWTPYQYNPDINPSKDVTAYLERRGWTGAYETIGRVQENGKASIHWTTGQLNAQSAGTEYAAPGQYYIRVVNNVTGASDRSDAPFTIKPRSVDVKVNGSDGPLTINPSAKVKVSWTSTGKNSCTLYGVSDSFVSGGSTQPTMTNMPTSGTRDVYVWFYDPSYGTSVGAQCTDALGNATNDWVQINATPQSASMRVLNPNGGEQIQPYKEYVIRTNFSGVSTMSVALYKNDQWVKWLYKDQPALTSPHDWYWTPGAEEAAMSSQGSVFKIYATGVRTDGSGYVDDKSDAPFGFGGGSTTAGTLTVSTDSSSPAYRIVAGGSAGVRLAAYNFHATGESINITKVGLFLSSGRPADLTNVYIYGGSGQILGSGIFAGASTDATIVLTTPLTVPKDGDARVWVVGDIANIGTAQPATSGDNIIVDAAAWTQGVGMSSGQTITTMGYYSSVAGVRIFRSFPMVSPIPLSSTGLEDGRLLRFTVTANPSGSVGLDGFKFNVSPSNVSVGTIQLYGYTDGGYSQPIAGFTGGFIGQTGVLQGDYITPTPTQVLEIPAGQTYYFELRGALSNQQPGASVTSVLSGDTWFHTPSTLQGAYSSGSHFVWTPNTYTMSGPNDVDWTNGIGISGLPPGGILQARTGSVSVAPNITSWVNDMVGNASVLGTNLAGSANNPTVVLGGISAVVTYAGDTSINIDVPSSLTVGNTYDLYVTNSNGMSNTYRATISSVKGGQQPTPTFSAWPNSGTAPLNVYLTMTGVPSSSSYSVNFGDGTSGSSWTADETAGTYFTSHAYNAAGTYTAALMYQPPMPTCPSGMACMMVMPVPVQVGSATITVSGTNCGFGGCSYKLDPETYPTDTAGGVSGSSGTNTNLANALAALESALKAILTKLGQ